jgi:small redox-active disulfide protein 2
MKITILGSGCPSCRLLEAQARRAVEELALKDAQVEHIYDIEKIIEMGIMMTPVLVIDDEIKTMGRIPPLEQIKNWLQEKNKSKINQK